MNNRVLQFKLVLLGESAVGKSSLVSRFVKGYQDYQEPTIGAAFLTQTVCLDDTTVKIEIWDTAGYENIWIQPCRVINVSYRQERYHSLAPMYYRGAQAAIVAYDITSQESFEKAKVWIRELHNMGSPNIVIVLVGNKVDLADKREVSSEEGEEYATSNGLLFSETSAKTGENVNEMFLMIARKLPKTSPTPVQKKGTKITNNEPTETKSSCC